MASSVRPVRSKGDSKTACPICSGDGCAVYLPGGRCKHCFGSGIWKSPRTQKEWSCKYCVNGERQATIICRRVQSPYPTQSRSGWIHSLDAERAAILPIQKDNQLPPASIEVRHAFYEAFLDSLPLYDEHFNHLQQIRGLSEDSIVNAQFKSLPVRTIGDALVRSLTASNPGIPGLFTVNEKLCLHLSGLNGFYIPIRDEQKRIAALQVRSFSLEPKAAKYLMLSGAPKDWIPRASAGCPNHFIRFDPGATSVLAVEGILKSEIVAEYCGAVGLRCPIVACVGTGSYGEMGAQLKRLMPGLRVAFTAFDWDELGTKSRADTDLRRERLHQQFADAGVKAEAVEWDGAKGFDDYLLSLNRGAW